MTPDSLACTPCPGKCPGQSIVNGIKNPTASFLAAAVAPTASEEGPHAPATPAQPSRPHLDPILAGRALATLNLINAVGKSAAQANGVHDISKILRQKFIGDTMAATAGQQ